MLRCGLQKASISPPLFIGTGIHRGLDAYYKSGCDLGAAVQEVHGWVKRRTMKIVKHTGALWDSERDTIREAFDLMRAMLLHYDMWVGARDENYEFVSTETHYEVPIINPDDVHELTGLQLAGRYDAILRSKSTGQMYVGEFKTTQNIKNISWIYRSMQGTAYTWAAKQLYPGISGILYRMLWKRIPVAPRRLKKGGFSVAKNQTTSYEYWGAALDRLTAKAFEAQYAGQDASIQLPLDIVGSVEEAKVFMRSHYRQFLGRLREQGNPFFEERILRKSEYQFDALQHVLYYIGKQMADSNVVIFPNPSWFHCNRCDFKDPCNLMNVEGDYEALLEAEYGPRTYWEDNN